MASKSTTSLLSLPDENGRYNSFVAPRFTACHASHEILQYRPFNPQHLYLGSRPTSFTPLSLYLSGSCWLALAPRENLNIQASSSLDVAAHRIQELYSLSRNYKVRKDHQRAPEGRTQERRGRGKSLGERKTNLSAIRSVGWPAKSPKESTYGDRRRQEKQRCSASRYNKRPRSSAQKCSPLQADMDLP